MQLTKSLASLSAFTLLVSSASAELLVYEGFNYSPAVTDGNYPAANYSDPFNPPATNPLLKGKSGGGEVGLTGSWAESTNDGDDWFVVENSLSFGDLATSGNKIGFRDNLDNDNASRGLDGTATAGIAGASEIWFSMLFNPTDVRSASAGGFALTDNNLNPGRITDTSSGVQGFGIGSNASHNFRPYLWDGTTRIDGDAELATSQDTTYFLVGHVSFDTGTAGADEYTLYNYTLNGGSVVGGTLNAIASTIEGDVDQSVLDLININRQVEFEGDELRIGTTFDDVVTAVPEASTFALIGFSGLLLLRRRRR